MQRHTFRTLIFDSPPTMIDGLITMSFANAPFTLSGTVSIGTTAIGVHAIKEVRDVVGGRNIDVTESGVTRQVL